MDEVEWENVDVQLPAVRPEERPALEERLPEPAHRHEERNAGTGERRIDPWSIMLKGIRCPVDRCPGPVEIVAITVTTEPEVYNYLMSRGIAEAPRLRHRAEIEICCEWCKTRTTASDVPVGQLLYESGMYRADLGGNPDIEFASGGFAR